MKKKLPLIVFAIILIGVIISFSPKSYTPILSATATLDFPNTLPTTSSDLTITLNGVSDGDTIFLGVPNGATSAGSCYTAWASSSNQVTVRFLNITGIAINPSSGTFKVSNIK